MSQVSMNGVDIGLPQLAMHSSYETAGIKDTYYMVKVMEEFFNSPHIRRSKFIFSKNCKIKVNA